MCVGLNTYHARLQNPMSPVGKHLRNDEATEAQQCKCKVCPESIHPGEVRNFLPCDLCAYFASTLAIHFFSVGEAAGSSIRNSKVQLRRVFMTQIISNPHVFAILLRMPTNMVHSPRKFIEMICVIVSTKVLLISGGDVLSGEKGTTGEAWPSWELVFRNSSRASRFCLDVCIRASWSLLLGSHQQVVVIGWEFTWQRAMVEEDRLSFVAQCSRSGAAQPDPLWHLTMRSMFVVCSFAEPSF